MKDNLKTLKDFRIIESKDRLENIQNMAVERFVIELRQEAIKWVNRLPSTFYETKEFINYFFNLTKEYKKETLK